MGEGGVVDVAVVVVVAAVVVVGGGAVYVFNKFQLH
jgi:hypothetical protein